MDNNIASDSIILTPIDDSYTDLIVKWRNSKRVHDNFIIEEPLTPEMHREWLREKVGKGLAKQFIIIEKETNKPIGTVYFRDIDLEKGEAEYGIFIGEENATGQGYGNQVAKLAINYAFNQMQLNRVVLRVFEDNEAAVKSYKNAGFKIIPNEETTIDKNGADRKLIFMEIERQG